MKIEFELTEAQELALREIIGHSNKPKATENDVARQIVVESIIQGKQELVRLQLIG